jgi:uncharacterized RDD family membrane protein YckC
MKLVDAIILSLAVAFVIIGIYEVMAYGAGKAYWAIMLAVLLFFYYTYRKRQKGN